MGILEQMEQLEKMEPADIQDGVAFLDILVDQDIAVLEYPDILAKAVILESLAIQVPE